MLQVKFRNGHESRGAYKADQLRWTDENDGWDVVEVRRV